MGRKIEITDSISDLLQGPTEVFNEIDNFKKSSTWPFLGLKML
jgi:hypothetical protein